MPHLSPVTFSAPHEGTHFLVLGSVHGNEKCGTIAINRVIEDIKSGTVVLAQGRVTFVPICNPRAYEKDVRYTERNLNRYLVPMATPDCYEAELGNELCPLLESCDILLDIHSYTAGGPPFVFVGLHDEAGHKFAACLGDVTLLTGWQEAFKAAGKTQNEGSDESTGTTEYARRFGATAVTLECGQHKDPAAPEIAYHAILNALRYLGIVTDTQTHHAPSSVHTIVMTHIFDRLGEDRLTQDWKHLQFISQNTVIGTRADNTPVKAPADGFIIMPNTPPPQWFYFGVERKTIE